MLLKQPPGKCRTWAKVAEACDNPNHTDEGPWRVVWWEFFGQELAPDVHVPRTHYIPAYLYDDVINYVGQKGLGEPVEWRGDPDLYLDPGGGFIGPADENGPRVLTPEVSGLAYPVKVDLCHAGPMLDVIETMRRHPAGWRVYGKTRCLRTLNQFRLTVIPETDLDPIEHWLSSMSVESHEVFDRFVEKLEERKANVIARKRVGAHQKGQA